MTTRQRVWNRVSEERGVHRRRYILDGSACFVFAFMSLTGLLWNYGLDEFIARHVGPFLWDLVIGALSCGWILLGASYLAAAFDERPVPPRWWITWVR